jgi:phosphoglycerate dehydrogenase-like enzyme
VEKEAVAELSLSLTLAAARHIVSGATAVKEGLWSSRASFIGLELKEKQVGLIGLGNIGSRVAEIFGVGFKSKVVAYDPHLSSKQFSNLGVTSLPLEELLSSSDIISLHCPLTEATKRILDRERISKMKPGAILINTCRGELLDQTALIERLTSKQLRVYATDVVEGEPIDNNHPLLSLNNVIVLPHLGGYTEQSLFGMGETMVNDCENVFVNKTTPNTLANPNVLSSERKRWA